FASRCLSCKKRTLRRYFVTA
ncbi:HAMP domain protein, partial [Vibrio parahaemolyticus V-223/04]